MTQLSQHPLEIAPVNVAAVIPALGVLMVGVVVQLTHLVAAVQHGDAALNEHPCVQHQIAGDCALQLEGVLLVVCSLHAAQGCGGAAEAGVAKARVVVVQLAPAVAAGPLAGEPVIQVFLVCNLVRAKAAAQPGVIQTPADVIMAAQVVEEQKLPGQSAYGVHLMAQQRNVAGGQCVPGGGHGGHIVEHVALGLFRGAEVGDHLGRLHNHLTQQQNTGADDLTHNAHHANQGVDLRQVAAAGAQLLPDIGNSIQTDHINAPVGEVKQVFRHVVEDHRICIVQVPLVGVEGGHNHLIAVRQPGEAAGSGGGEHLRNGFLKLVGNVPVVVEEIPFPVAGLTGTGFFGPLMILAGMIHYKVQAQAHALGTAGIRQGFQVFHGTQLRLDTAEIRHGIAAVAPTLRAFQQGHQMQVVNAALLQIGQLFLHAFQGAGKSAGIEHHAQQLPLAVPVGIGLAARVLSAQILFPLVPAAAEHAQKVIERGHIAIVQLAIQPFQFIIIFAQALVKSAGGLGGAGFLARGRTSLRALCHRIILPPIRLMWAWRESLRCGSR